jgi:predicted  nucleic acid-binding Zn-ribbon protein
LAQKARELEHEIDTYKKENSSLKHVRTQQELILAEMEQQRSDLKEWVESEKKATAAFCSESKEAAVRERRAAAKYVSSLIVLRHATPPHPTPHSFSYSATLVTVSLLCMCAGSGHEGSC